MKLFTYERARSPAEAAAAAAVANAVHNATGVRVRDYPITLDKLLEHLPAPERS